jgi:hypothetical protein
MNNQQIGRGGELLVQYKLLLLGIESSPMTSGSGIDLVAYSSRNRKAYTVLVKTNDSPSPFGDKGQLSLGWWVPEDCPADLVAFVDLSSNSVWLFSMGEMPKYSKRRFRGRYHFYFYVDPSTKSEPGNLTHKTDFNQFILERRALVFF